MPAASARQDVARRLTDDGYVVVTGMLAPDGVERARADLDRVLRTTRTGRNDFEGFATQRVYALFAKTRAFDALATDPLLLGVLDQVLGPLPAQRAGRHRDRAGREGAGPAPRRRDLPGARAASAAGGQHDVAARRVHRRERRHQVHPRQPPLGAGPAGRARTIRSRRP